MVASPSATSASSAALTVTVCAVDQFAVVKVSAAVDRLRSLSPVFASVTVTCPLGAASSTRV